MLPLTRRHALATLQGRPHVLVPLDHGSVLHSRPPEHVYAAVRDRIERDAGAFLAFYESLMPLLFCPELEAVPDEQGDELEPYWNNGFFSGLDGRAAYAACGVHQPKTILEVGSGNSTKFFRKAIREHETGTTLVSVDPEPRAEIDQLCDHVIRRDVSELDFDIFTSLKAGDFLFWDGSHLVFNGTDAVTLVLEVLPRLAPGVLVHVHDIQLPYEYGAEFDGRGYAEQYLLGAFLVGEPAIEVILPVTYLARTRHTLGGVSFWMRTLER